MKQGNLIGTDQTTLTDRIKDYKENNPDYNPRDFLSDNLDIRQLRKDLMSSDYTWKEIAIDSALLFGTGILITYLMYKEQIELLVDYYFK